MKKQWAISNFKLAVLVFAVSSGWADASSSAASYCEELSKFSLQSIPRPNAVERFQLDAVLDQKVPGLEQYFNLDIDGDDANDVVKGGCQGSVLMPADPCTLSIKLSSSGETLDFEAWGFLVFRHKGQIFIAANADETKKKTNMYRIEKTGFKLMCKNL